MLWKWNKTFQIQWPPCHIQSRSVPPVLNTESFQKQQKLKNPLNTESVWKQEKQRNPLIRKSAKKPQKRQTPLTKDFVVFPVSWHFDFDFWTSELRSLPVKTVSS